MIGYVCKYTPVEVFEAMGVEIGRIQPEVTNFNQADTLMGLSPTASMVHRYAF